MSCSNRHQIALTLNPTSTLNLSASTLWKSLHTFNGCALSRNNNIDDEVNSGIANASSAFGCLNKTVVGRSGITKATKLSVFNAVVLTTLLYAYETWTVYQSHIRKLNHVHTVCLRKILGIRWQDKTQIMRFYM